MPSPMSASNTGLTARRGRAAWNARVRTSNGGWQMGEMGESAAPHVAVAVAVAVARRLRPR